MAVPKPPCNGHVAVLDLLSLPHLTSIINIYCTCYVPFFECEYRYLHGTSNKHKTVTGMMPMPGTDAEARIKPLASSNGHGCVT
jgi:hypothetical protein